jgi:hypothetical protein
MSTKPGPHPIRCGKFFKYHAWRSTLDAKGQLTAGRYCKRCPAVGIVNDQGVTVLVPEMRQHR